VMRCMRTQNRRSVTGRQQRQRARAAPFYAHTRAPWHSPSSRILWSPNEGFFRARRRRPCPPRAFAGGGFFLKRAHGKVEFACSRAAGMQSPVAPGIWPGGTLAMSGSGDASTPPATGTELSRLPSNRPDPKADHDKGMAPAAGYVGVCYISVTMVHHC